MASCITVMFYTMNVNPICHDKSTSTDLGPRTNDREMRSAYYVITSQTNKMSLIMKSACGALQINPQLFYGFI